jgi:hypothetical protein
LHSSLPLLKLTCSCPVWLQYVTFWSVILQRSPSRVATWPHLLVMQTLICAPIIFGRCPSLSAHELALVTQGFIINLLKTWEHNSVGRTLFKDTLPHSGVQNSELHKCARVLALAVLSDRICHENAPAVGITGKRQKGETESEEHQGQWESYKKKERGWKNFDSKRKRMSSKNNGKVKKALLTRP